MAEVLSEEWFERYAEAGAALPEQAGVDTTITYEIGGAPDGKVRWHETITAGRVTAVADGKNKDADIAITWKFDEFQRLLAAEKTFDASFMEGRTKVEGDYVTWILGMRSMRETEEFEAFLAALA